MVRAETERAEDANVETETEGATDDANAAIWGAILRIGVRGEIAGIGTGEEEEEVRSASNDSSVYDLRF